jgi:hypothetical protein
MTRECARRARRPSAGDVAVAGSEKVLLDLPAFPDPNKGAHYGGPLRFESALLLAPYPLILMTRYMPVAASSAAAPKGLTRTVYSVPAAALLGTRRL